MDRQVRVIGLKTDVRCLFKAREAVSGTGDTTDSKTILYPFSAENKNITLLHLLRFFLSSYALIYLLIFRVIAFYINLKISVKSVKALELLLPSFTAPLPDQISEAVMSA